ncbi:MAG: hypothetical protein NEHIOOID_00283 [Holosporales bacterium]
MFNYKILLGLLAFFAASPSFASAAAPAFCDVSCQKLLDAYDRNSMPLDIPGAYSIKPDRINQAFFDELPRPLAYFLLNKDDNERESALYLYVYEKVRDYIIDVIVATATPQPRMFFYIVNSSLTSNFQSIFGKQKEPIEKRIDETLKFIVTELKKPHFLLLPEDIKGNLILSQNIENELKRNIFDDPNLNDILSLPNTPHPKAMLTKLMIVVNSIYFKIDHALLEVNDDRYVKILPESLLGNHYDFMSIVLKHNVVTIQNPDEHAYFLFNHFSYFKLIQERIGFFNTLVLGCGRFKKGDWIYRTKNFGTEAFPLGLDQYFVSSSCTDPHNRDLTVARMPHIMPHIVADIKNEDFITKLRESGLRFRLIIDESGILENNPDINKLYERLLCEGGQVVRHKHF